MVPGSTSSSCTGSRSVSISRPSWQNRHAAPPRANQRSAGWRAGSRPRTSGNSMSCPLCCQNRMSQREQDLISISLPSRRSEMTTRGPRHRGTTRARKDHRHDPTAHLNRYCRRLTTASRLKATWAQMPGPRRPVRVARMAATSPNTNSAGNWSGSKSATCRTSHARGHDGPPRADSPLEGSQHQAAEEDLLDDRRGHDHDEHEQDHAATAVRAVRQLTGRLQMSSPVTEVHHRIGRYKECRVLCDDSGESRAARRSNTCAGRNQSTARRFVALAMSGTASIPP